MRLGRSVPSCTPSLNGQPLDRVHQYKYLGVVLTDDLTWSTRISEITNKARKQLKLIIGLIYRQFYSMSSTPSLLQLYTSLVRPHLEYATQVWDPFLIKDIHKLESVQKFALKICCKHWDTSCSENLHQNLLPELSLRRRYLSLSYFYNLINGHFEFFRICQPCYINLPYSTCSGYASIYVQPFAHSNSYLFPKTISL